MPATDQNNLPLLVEGQASGEVTHNECLRMLDALAGIWRIHDQNKNSPPSNPDAGQAWIVQATASGAWTGHEGEIAIWSGSEYLFITPQEGTVIADQDTDNIEVYDGSAWQVLHSNAW